MSEDVTTHITLEKSLLKKIKKEIEGFDANEKLEKCVIAGYQILSDKTKQLEETLHKHIRITNPVRTFLSMTTILDPEAYTPKRELYKAFLDYCFTEKLPSTSNQKFKRKLLENYPHLLTVRRKGLRCWLGIAMDDDDQ